MGRFWCGKGRDKDGRVIIAVDENTRPTEVETLLGDATKAKKACWSPKLPLEQLVNEMIEEDLNSAKRDELIRKHGFKTMDYNERMQNSNKNPARFFIQSSLSY